MMQYFKYFITILFVDGICAILSQNGFVMKEKPSLNDENITRLDLSHNNLLGLNRKTFNGYKKLEQLYIINSRIVFIDDGTFQDLRQLKELNIAKNFIRRLTSKTFSSENNLEKLVVYGNMLNDLEDFDIFYFPKLKYFDISNNQLTHLPNGLMKKLRQDENFTLITRSNFWNCSNEAWLKDMNFRMLHKFCLTDNSQIDVLIPLPLKKTVKPIFVHCVFWTVGAFWVGIIAGNFCLIRKMLCKKYAEDKIHQSTQQDTLAVLYTVDRSKSMRLLQTIS